MSNKNTGKNPIDNLKPRFTKDNQPSSDAKKRGWERRREAQRILDLFKALGEMSVKEFRELQEDIKLHPDDHSIQELKLVQYMSKEKFIIDYLDRHISKAPTEVNLSADVNVKKESKSLKELFNFEQAKRGTNRQGKGSSK